MVLSGCKRKMGTLSRYMHTKGSLRNTVRLLAHSTQLTLFLSLLVYSVVSVLYFWKPTKSQSNELESYETTNLTATEVACAFPISGQYGITLQYTYFVLLVLAVSLRHQQWLGAAIAASALTYSGVAAVHLVVFFAVYRRPSTTSRCNPFKTGSQVDTENILGVPICAGVFDPDYTQACEVVGAGLLAVLPMAMWSTTFRNTVAKPILFLWTMLLTIGHTFFFFIITDDHRHYQICPKGVVEPLPGNDYIARPLDLEWETRFFEITSGVGSSAKSSPNGLCIYSCFASSKHLGRQDNEIGVYNPGMLQLNHGKSSRNLGVVYWIVYFVLAGVSIFVEKRHRSSRPHILLPYVRVAIHVISVAAYFGYLGFHTVHQKLYPQSEGFSAVGQWSTVATVVLVVVAAFAGRFAQSFKHRMSYTDDGISEDPETWTCEVGYAS